MCFQGSVRDMGRSTGVCVCGGEGSAWHRQGTRPKATSERSFRAPSLRSLNVRFLHQSFCCCALSTRLLCGSCPRFSVAFCRGSSGRDLVCHIEKQTFIQVVAYIFSLLACFNKQNFSIWMETILKNKQTNKLWVLLTVLHLPNPGNGDFLLHFLYLPRKIQGFNFLILNYNQPKLIFIRNMVINQHFLWKLYWIITFTSSVQHYISVLFTLQHAHHQTFSFCHCHCTIVDQKFLPVKTRWYSFLLLIQLSSYSSM